MAATQTRANGIVALEVKMSNLFADIKSITSKIEKPEGRVEDLLLTVSLDDQLLSAIQKQMLNPMVIKVCSASQMPNTPMCFSELKQK